MKRLRDRLAYGCKRLLFRLSPALAARCGIDFRLRAPSRLFLEREIFGYLDAVAAGGKPGGRCLFIGVDKHNWHYPRLLRLELHTIDLKPENAVYGPPGRHVVGSALELARHYPAESFDAVVANGLIGFGVDTEADFERLVAQCHAVLAPGGLLVLGYNDKSERTPFRLQRGLGRSPFEPHAPAIAGVRGARHRVQDRYRHEYVFLRKPGAWGTGAGMAPRAFTARDTAARRLPAPGPGARTRAGPR